MKTKRILSFIISLIMCFTIAGTIPAMAASAWTQEQYYLDTIAAYNDFNYSDPQYITDAEFFGVWDSETNSWKEGFVPYLYYEEYPELAAVEEAAKLGDYELCKEEVLAYYREKSSNYNMGYTRSNLSDRSRAWAEQAFHNMGSGDAYNKTCGRTYFTKNAGWHTISIMSDIASIQQTATKRKVYCLIAANKDGYRVEIDDSINRPYVTVEVNGEVKTYYPTRTTYVDGNVHSQADLVQGKLLIEESVTSIGKVYPRDENTKRAFVQFDFPNIVDTDQLGGATLHLYGKMVEDDIENGLHIDREYKMVHAFPWSQEQEIKGDLTFDKLNTFKELCYNMDGEPNMHLTTVRITDPEDAATTSPGSAISYAADAYVATGDETFAFHVIRSILGNIIDTGDYETYCASNPHGLNAASWGYSTLWIIDKLMPSIYMTPEAFTMILKRTHIAGQWLEEHWTYQYEKVNWGGYSVSGLLAIAMMYPEFRDAHGELWRDENGDYYLDNEFGGSVRGGWLHVANFRNSYKVGGNMHEDGSSFEASHSYSFESLGAYLSPMQYGKKLNFDYSVFYTPQVEDESDYIYVGKQRAVMALRYLATRMNPRFGAFQVGDDGAWTENFGAYLQDYLEVLDDPLLEFVGTNREEGEEPDFQTSVYDDGVVATFRDHWKDDNAIGMSFQTPGRANHSHQDDLSVSMVAYGNFLLTDQRMGNYDEEDRSERWVSSTRGHNTIEINDTVGRGTKVYAIQYDPIVFATEIDENGNEVPKKDENGIEMKDDPLYVPINQSAITTQKGSLNPDDREINTVYDYIRGTSRTYYDDNAPTLFNEDFDLERDILFLRSGYFVVVDYGKPEYGLEYNYQDDYQKANNIEGHKYKQLWHFLPRANMTIDEETNTMRTNFSGQANIIVATVKNNDNMTINTKYGLYASKRSVFDVCKYGTFEQYKKGPMTFNTILYPMPAGKDAEIRTTKLETNYTDDVANAFMATITDKERRTENEIYFYTLFDKTQKAPTTFGAYETDGTLSLGEKKEGSYVNAVLRQGSYLENILDNEYVIYSEEEIEDIGVYWQLDEIDIAYDTEDSYNNDIDFSKLTVKANGNVSKVRVNGEEVSFKQSGKYIYFGEEPILDGGDEIPGGNEENNGSSTEGNHGTAGDSSVGGNSSGGGGGSSSENEKEEKPVTPPTEPVPAPIPSDTYKSELDGHWAENEITNLVDAEVVQGFGDGTLGLNRNITRAQFITMLVRALALDISDYNGSFADISKNDWHADYMETAFRNGWIQGDGTNAYPNRNITREEMTKILVSAFEQKYGEIDTLPENKFTDIDEISLWANEFINKAVGAGLVNGMGNGEFKPKDNAKREQAMVLIYRLINRPE